MSLQTNTLSLSQVRLLAACFIGVALGYSSTYFYSSGLFLLPLSSAFLLSRGQVSLGPLTSSLVAAVMLPLVGRWVDRVGPATVGVASLFTLSACFFLGAYFVDGFSSYLAYSAATAILGVGSTALPFSRLVLHSFARGRGLALGFVLTGTGAGAIVIPLLLLPAIAQNGWRAGLTGLGGAVLVAAFVVTILLFPRMRADRAEGRTSSLAASKPDMVPFRLSGRLALIGAIFFLAAISVVSIVVHYVPMLRDAGVPAAKAGQLASLIGLSSIVGRLVIGFLLDRFPPEALALGLFALVALGSVALAADPAAMAMPGAIAAGFAVGAELDILAFFVARYFAPGLYGRVYGSVFGLYMIGGAIGPGAAGYLHDVFGSYRAGLLMSLVFVVLSALVTIALWRTASPKSSDEAGLSLPPAAQPQ